MVELNLPQEDTIKRDDEPEPEVSAAADVTRWINRVKMAKGHFKDVFKSMKDDMELHRLGATPAWIASGKYTVNLLQRYVHVKQSGLYAKNPRARAKRKSRLEYKLWDGTPGMLQATYAALQQNPQDPQSLAIMQDMIQGLGRKKMLTKLGKTLEILFHDSIEESGLWFKKSMKQMVARTIVTCIGYLKIDYQRVLEKRPEVEARIADVTDKLAKIEQISSDMIAGEIENDEADAATLHQMLADLEAQSEVITREGLVYSFPKSTRIIIDPDCEDIRTLFGAHWIATEMVMTPDAVKRTYNVDIGQNYQGHKADASIKMNQAMLMDEKTKNKGMVMVWEIQDKDSGLVFTIADGHSDYLKAPARPSVVLERFFNVFCLAFNTVEDEDHLYPPSDITLLRSPQYAYNRSRESLRVHRKANIPRYGAAKGALENQDIKSLAGTGEQEILLFNSLLPGQKIEDILQRIPTIPIDQALYTTSDIFEDILRTGGAQEANIGGTSGASATETSIAEGSRVNSVSNNVDDLDDFLTEVAQAAGQILMGEMSTETVFEIAGPGAVWAEYSQDEISREIHLEIKAASSGRPNKAQEMANLERIGPLLVQMPGLNPLTLLKKMLELMDDGFDIEEALMDGAMSIVAQNQQAGAAQPGTGDPATDPASQGPQGANNAPAAPGQTPGPQAGFPTG